MSTFVFIYILNYLLRLLRLKICWVPTFSSNVYNITLKFSHFLNLYGIDMEFM